MEVAGSGVIAYKNGAMPRVDKAKSTLKGPTARLGFEAKIKEPDTALRGTLKKPGV